MNIEDNGFNSVTSQVRKYLLWSKIPRFELGSSDPRLGIRISQWKDTMIIK